jgi:hypothetical protein
MFAKIVKGKDLTQLETAVNKFIADCYLQPVIPGSDNQKKLKVYNVQQFVIGEMPNTTLMNSAPVPNYSFCLLLICGYE